MERVVDFFCWLFRREKHEIGRRELPRYLTRWVLWGKRFGPGRKVFLHCFHNGDPEPYDHNHPWPFWSLILWGGYYEHTPEGVRWYGPLSLLCRPADWRHHVTLTPGKRCWTLIWTGLKTNPWGFFCEKGFVPWREHEANYDKGLPGCGE